MHDNSFVCRWLERYFKWDSGVEGCQILDRSTVNFDTRLNFLKSSFFRSLDENFLVNLSTFFQYYFSKHPVSTCKTRLHFSENHSRLYRLFATHQNCFWRGEPTAGNFLPKPSSNSISVSAGCDLYSIF